MSAIDAPALGRIELPTTAKVKERPRSETPTPTVELTLFAALGFVALAQWSRLLVDSPMIKLLFALGAICAGARLLLAIPARRDRGMAMTLLATVVAIATGALALMIAGLPGRLLLPANWGELATNLGDGLRGVEDAPVPYDGANPWVALDLTLAGPAIAALAAAIGFWPAAHRARRRLVALVLLIAAYAIPATLYPPDAPLFWGLVLLLGAAAWLWIGRLHGGRRNLALAAALGAGALALPVAARAGDEPLLDYQNWDWFGGSASVAFQWDHEYGPLDWPRDGATMLSVETSRPLYWKASVLDRFDGYRWERAQLGDPRAVAERNARRETPGGALNDLHPGWVQEAHFRIEGLRTNLLIGAGTPLVVADIDADRSVDGTLSHPSGALEGGAEYSIITYDPNPTVDQMQSAPARYPADRFAGTTLLGFSSALTGPTTVSMPLWGTSNPTVERLMLTSSYAETYQLAQSWTAEATTPYEAVTAIMTRLRQSYTYTPEVPIHEFPLQGFLFQDRAGYCQQFAGSLALMLRMLGIPSRVVSGFAPGTPDSSDGSYEVHDFDAHSWVEVFFRGIGWVTFDPTPAAAPAESQRLGGAVEPERRGAAILPGTEQGGEQGGGGSDGAAAGASDGADGSTGWAVAAIVLTLAGAVGAGAFVLLRRRRVPAGELSDAHVAELRKALERSGWHLGRGATLLGLEERVAVGGRRAVADYARALRRNRFAPPGSPSPSSEQRRAMRRALIAGGPLRRLRAWFLVPPGGPRPLR